jgi:hypothetical protein
MNSHPYVRAYMAGIVVPTLFLIVVLTAFITLRLILKFPAPIERVIVFPMAAVPNLWGLWNMLYVRLNRGRHISAGMHGAILPFVLALTAVCLGTASGVVSVSARGLIYFGALYVDYGHIAIGFFLVVGIYYLVWKYVVNFFNGVVGVA